MYTRNLTLKLKSPTLVEVTHLMMRPVLMLPGWSV